jgi:hypothetical protein
VGCDIAGSASAVSTAITSHFNAPRNTGTGRITMQRFRLMKVYLALVLLVLIGAIVGTAWLRPS